MVPVIYVSFPFALTIDPYPSPAPKNTFAICMSPPQPPETDFPRLFTGAPIIVFIVIACVCDLSARIYLFSMLADFTPLTRYLYGTVFIRPPTFSTIALHRSYLTQQYSKSVFPIIIIIIAGIHSRVCFLRKINATECRVQVFVCITRNATHVSPPPPPPRPQVFRLL